MTSGLGNHSDRLSQRFQGGKDNNNYRGKSPRSHGLVNVTMVLMIAHGCVNVY